MGFPSKPSTAPSLLWLAAIQYFKRVKDSAGLAPKSRFVTAEPIEREVGKVSETQKATGELDIWSAGFHPGVRYPFYISHGIVRNCVRPDGIGPPEHFFNNVTRIGEELTVVPMVAQRFSLNFEQSTFHRSGTAQPP